MNLATSLQPDQQPARWEDDVAAYEAVFEPLSLAFARRALDLLGIRPGDRLIDVGAGCGGAALAAANRGAQVLAVDASSRMVARMRARANGTNGGAGRIWAVAMDGTALAVPNASFDAALSVFGVILFPDAVRGMRVIVRVLKPGGRVAVVSWTETERYELAARLSAAIAEVRGPQPPPSVLPAQLRFREEPVFRSLFAQAGADGPRNRPSRAALASAVGALDRRTHRVRARHGSHGARPRGRSSPRPRCFRRRSRARSRPGRSEPCGNRPCRACDKARMVKKSARGA